LLVGFGFVTYVNPRLLPWTLVYVGSGDFTYQYDDSKIQIVSISFSFTRAEGNLWGVSTRFQVKNKLTEPIYLLVICSEAPPGTVIPHYTGLVIVKLSVASGAVNIGEGRLYDEITATREFVLRFYEADSDYHPKEWQTGADCVAEVRRIFDPSQYITVTTATTQMTTSTGTVTTVTGGRTFTVTTERLRVVTVTGGSTVTVTTTYSGQVLPVPFRLSDVSLVLFVVGACLGVLALMILLLRLARSSSGKSLPRPSEARRRRK